MNPSFRGIGGASEKPIGYVTIPVYMPDAAHLLGRAGKVTKIWIEFPVVKELHWNFLLGRDAMRAYKFDFIESESHILVGDVKVPITDHKENSVYKTMSRQACNTITAKD